MSLFLDIVKIKYIVYSVFYLLVFIAVIWRVPQCPLSVFVGALLSWSRAFPLAPVSHKMQRVPGEKPLCYSRSFARVAVPLGVEVSYRCLEKLLRLLSANPSFH